MLGPLPQPVLPGDREGLRVYISRADGRKP